MTEQEYKSLSNRIDEYKNCQCKLLMLRTERLSLESGLISIGTSSGIYINLREHNKEFRDNLLEVVLNFYDEAIESLKIKMDNL